MPAKKATTTKPVAHKAPALKTESLSEHRIGSRALLEKIVVNAGVGRASQLPNFEDKILKQIQKDIARLAGQQPHVRKAKKSIAGFKIREGQTVGVRVTLRGPKMVDFFERFIRIVLPRVRDFSGIALGNVDQGGVANIGIREQLVFPEINPEESFFIFPLQVTLVPKHKDRAEALAAYRSLGVPLQAEESLNAKKKK
jgi:large subunit ribosomal protein L5